MQNKYALLLTNKGQKNTKKKRKGKGLALDPGTYCILPFKQEENQFTGKRRQTFQKFLIT